MVTSPDSSLPPLTLYSIVIPAQNESTSIVSTVEHIHVELRLAGIAHEIVVVDDGSQDDTFELVEKLAKDIREVVPTRNEGPKGFGRAVAHGFEVISGDAVAIMMGDQSDDPRDAVKYWHAMQQGYDCAFGSRFMPGGGVVDYPRFKLLANRIVNWVIARLFRIDLNDTTNAFKAYRREVIEGCRPILSHHFNLTIELPLKSIIRGYSWTSLPINWRNRRSGEAKLQLKEMGSRYFFIMMYCWFEKYFSKGDYHRDSLRREPLAEDGGNNDLTDSHLR
jgi:dolichol-phosphate mannosyltransferase